MKRVPVSSSSLASVGYDPSTRTLEVEFHNGSVYEYFGVPATEHERLMEAESLWRHYNEYIKGAGYEYRQVQ